MTSLTATPQRRASDIARAKERQRQFDQIADLERRAVRITTGPAGRCFELERGHLVAILNEPQPTDGHWLRIMAVIPITREDAEDFYGWAPA